jgi:TusA-related sulfurtransferase
MAQRAMTRLAAGEELVVLSTDREAPIDLAAWAAHEGHGYSESRAGGWTEHRLVNGTGS